MLPRKVVWRRSSARTWSRYAIAASSPGMPGCVPGSEEVGGDKQAAGTKQAHGVGGVFGVLVDVAVAEDYVNLMVVAGEDVDSMRMDDLDSVRIARLADVFLSERGVVAVGLDCRDLGVLRAVGQPEGAIAESSADFEDSVGANCAGKQAP